MHIENDVIQLNVTARGKLTFSTKKVDLAELQKISNDIFLVGNKLIAFCNEHFPQIITAQGTIAESVVRNP